MTVRLLFYVSVVALAIFNGIYSPRSFLVFALQGIWYPGFLPAPLSAMVVLSGFISAILHLLVTGVPVAIIEKSGMTNQDFSALLWFGFMTVPTFQTLRHLGWL
jgi:hypothetical protein